MRTLLPALAALAVAIPATGRADVVELIDNTRIAGTVVHYFDGVLTVESGGQRLRIPKEKVRSLGFKTPPPRAELGTPAKTFERWRAAAAAGDVERMIDCYSLMVQGTLAFQMNEGGEESLRRLREEFQGVRFTIKSTQQKGERATLKVQRQLAEDVQTIDIQLVRENGEWKLLPPQP